MKKQAILIVSFGVIKKASREETLDLYEEEVRRACSNFDVFHAYASTRIIDKIKAREGIEIHSPSEALKKMMTMGYEQIVVQPFGLICGETFLQLVERIKQSRQTGVTLKLLLPLLHDACDYAQVAQNITSEAALPSEKTALVFVGHGTYTDAQRAYLTLAEVLGKRTPPAFFGTIKNDLTVESVSAQLKKRGIESVVLRPFLLTAGHHVKKDIQMDWANGLRQAGFSVQIDFKPLGAYASVRRYFLALLKEAL